MSKVFSENMFNISARSFYFQRKSEKEGLPIDFYPQIYCHVCKPPLGNGWGTPCSPHFLVVNTQK